MDNKAALRQELRARRRDHALAVPDQIRSLLFKSPPRPLLQCIPQRAIIGLYHAGAFEAPSSGYAKHFFEAGHTIALPVFANKNAAMGFAEHSDPFDEADLESGPFAIDQPIIQEPALVPDVVFVPLLGFTENGARLGQGGGHYDRWLAAHPGTIAIGMGWDCQLVSDLPVEAHDQPMTAIVTPTRLYGPF
ncbi:5-formyltetrahydrofolate cyclo-ligase [Pontixanthobacter sp.]|uniref:5-formyltetrahydrofolate cyclo-ligase n=1 Tax=Pontixanthobacter sp. TaxID=2792078 RepID=UPI003C7E7833